jgi:hypothetical protein
MKISVKIATAVAGAGLTIAAFADKYDDLAKKGYRWVDTDGPFACPAKDDLQSVIKNQSDQNQVHMVEQLKAYFLVRGALVQVVQEDKAAGMSQFNGGGLNCWTLSKFLSKRPIKDLNDTIETPVNPDSSTAVMSNNSQLGATALPAATATPSATATPVPSPTPTP